jgi:membrane-associated phospholipid phosphatase
MRIIFTLIFLMCINPLFADSLEKRYDSPTAVKLSSSKLGSDLRKFGDWARFGSSIGALGLIAYYKDMDGLIQFLESAGSTQIIMGATKEFANRKRPDGGEYSFPSGHTSSTFAPAAFVQFRYGTLPAIPFWIAAGITGYSRIEQDRHYISDVVGSAFLGIFMAKIFTKQYESGKKTIITPVVSDNFKIFGLNASMKF